MPGPVGLTGGALRPGIDYDGRCFRPLQGDPGTAPTARWHADGDLVWAEIAGGAYRAGRLVGRTDPDGTLHAAYCLLAADGEVIAGRCTSVPTVLADGRLRLEERWRRMDGTTGISWIEEVRDDEL